MGSWKFSRSTISSRKKTQYPDLIALINYGLSWRSWSRGGSSAGRDSQPGRGGAEERRPCGHGGKPSGLRGGPDGLLCRQPSFGRGDRKLHQPGPQEGESPRPFPWWSTATRPTSMEIYRALREFCDIPKGEVYISPEEADRHPRGPDQPLHLHASFPSSAWPRITSPSATWTSSCKRASGAANARGGWGARRRG